MRIDFEKLRQLLLPAVLRGSELLNAIVAAIMQCLSNVYAQWLQYVEKERRERTYNCQVINLRRAIADLLGCALALVTIEDVANQEYLYIYEQGMGRDVEISNATPTIIYSDAEIRYTRRFIVRVPAQYSTVDTDIRAILDRYKLVTTLYTIVYYE
jgi:hypothetical protein